MAERGNAFGCRDARGPRAGRRHGEAALCAAALPDCRSRFPGKAASLTPLQHLLDSASQKGASASAVAPGLGGELRKRGARGADGVACFAARGEAVRDG